jgi:hypothetical protein
MFRFQATLQFRSDGNRLFHSAFLLNIKKICVQCSKSKLLTIWSSFFWTNFSREFPSNSTSMPRSLFVVGSNIYFCRTLTPAQQSFVIFKYLVINGDWRDKWFCNVYLILFQWKTIIHIFPLAFIFILCEFDLFNNFHPKLPTARL